MASWQSDTVPHSTAQSEAEIKTCTLCMKAKGIAHFPRDRTKNGGFNERCKDCKNYIRRRNRFDEKSHPAATLRKHDTVTLKRLLAQADIKVCTCCGQVKTSAEFPRDRTRPDGFHQRCKDCKNAIRREQRAQVMGTISEQLLGVFNPSAPVCGSTASSAAQNALLHTIPKDLQQLLQQAAAASDPSDVLPTAPDTAAEEGSGEGSECTGACSTWQGGSGADAHTNSLEAGGLTSLPARSPTPSAPFGAGKPLAGWGPAVVARRPTDPADGGGPDVSSRLPPGDRKRSLPPAPAGSGSSGQAVKRAFVEWSASDGLLYSPSVLGGLHNAPTAFHRVTPSHGSHGSGAGPGRSGSGSGGSGGSGQGTTCCFNGVGGGSALDAGTGADSQRTGGALGSAGSAEATMTDGQAEDSGEMKECQRCHEVKSVEGFPRDRTRREGYHGWCKLCKNAHRRVSKAPAVVEAPAASKEERDAGCALAAPAADYKRCQRCSELKSTDEFPRDRTRREGVSGWCKLCKNAYRRVHKANRAPAAAPAGVEGPVNVVAPKRPAAAPAGLATADWTRRRRLMSIALDSSASEDGDSGEPDGAARGDAGPESSPRFQMLLKVAVEEWEGLAPATKPGRSGAPAHGGAVALLQSPPRVRRVRSIQNLSVVQAWEEAGSPRAAGDGAPTEDAQMEGGAGSPGREGPSAAAPEGACWDPARVMADAAESTGALPIPHLPVWQKLFCGVPQVQ